MRLDKFLGDQNIGTRKQIKEYIKNGRCTVNGEIAKKGDIHIDENNDVIAFDGNVLSFARLRYYILNKPQGVISATFDKEHETVIDLLNDVNTKDLAPVGRLDIDTEGLLVITNDGVLAHKLLSPKKHVKKVYEVHLEKPLSGSDHSKLEKGLDIGDKNDDGSIKYTLPANCVVAPGTSDSENIYHLTITEGRFHQVKRMMEALGNKVEFLKRIQMGGLLLPSDLKAGEFRELTAKELELLKNK